MRRRARRAPVICTFLMLLFFRGRVDNDAIELSENRRRPDDTINNNKKKTPYNKHGWTPLPFTVSRVYRNNKHYGTSAAHKLCPRISVSFLPKQNKSLILNTRNEFQFVGIQKSADPTSNNNSLCKQKRAKQLCEVFYAKPDGGLFQGVHDRIGYAVQKTTILAKTIKRTFPTFSIPFTGRCSFFRHPVDTHLNYSCCYYFFP